MACGRPCPPLSYCHEASNTCKACATICDAARPSQYEPALCHDLCREYLYEQLKTTYSVDGTARVLGWAGLGLSVLAILVVLAVVGLAYHYVLRRPRRLLNFLHSRVDVETTPDMKAKMSTNNNKHSMPDIGRDLNSSVHTVHTVSGSVSESERLHGTTSTLAATQCTQPSPTGMTLPFGMAALPAMPPPPPARHPSEDSTLDYAAYDNPGLSPSSSPLPPSAGSGTAHPAHGKAMDAVLDAVVTLPGAVTQLRANHYALNDLNNGPRMESSF
ncbi:uncharacterized protein LOC117654499 isoform X2 [Thrips palmi]|nr:uncharacterized protein LOC117654499 isoform X2 [Thrips palmi]